jgi:hypothetical protein
LTLDAREAVNLELAIADDELLLKIDARQDIQLIAVVGRIAITTAGIVLQRLARIPLV